GVQQGRVGPGQIEVMVADADQIAAQGRETGRGRQLQKGERLAATIDLSISAERQQGKNAQQNGDEAGSHHCISPFSRVQRVRQMPRSHILRASSTPRVSYSSNSPCSLSPSR